MGVRTRTKYVSCESLGIKKGSLPDGLQTVIIAGNVSYGFQPGRLKGERLDKLVRMAVSYCAENCDGRMQEAAKAYELTLENNLIGYVAIARTLNLVPEISGQGKLNDKQVARLSEEGRRRLKMMERVGFPEAPGKKNRSLKRKVEQQESLDIESTVKIYALSLDRDLQSLANCCQSNGRTDLLRKYLGLHKLRVESLFK